MCELFIPPSLREAHRRGLARYLATGEGLDAALDGIDTIVHAASDPFGNVQKTDSEGSRRLLERARAARVKHAVFVSP